MKKILTLILCLCAFSVSIMGQTFTLKGTITNKEKKSIAGATIVIMPTEQCITADIAGFFSISNLKPGVYQVEISSVGYLAQRDTLKINSNLIHNVQLKEDLVNLNEVVVTGNSSELRKKEMPLNVAIINPNYLRENLGGSLTKSLENLPGISSIEIGSGQSKPVIRGMGFNRIAIIENGIKHEAQQWGSDHGLEIDQYSVEEVEVIKGPTSLMYGSDAIGGVVNMKSNAIPKENSFGATIDLTGKTNNAFAGGSASFYFRKKSFFANLRATYLDYGDYKVPTDSVNIYSYRVPLYRHHVRNTAGKEQNLHLNFGYVGKHGFKSIFTISNIYSKTGFFANAHGLEPLNVNSELHDNSNRDLQQPFQMVDHFKIINESSYYFKTSTLSLNLGFQRNFRQEESQYVSHGYMPAAFPDSMNFTSNLEREYDKNVYSASLKYDLLLKTHTELKFGTDFEFQKNKINGYGFIIPAYQQLKTGTFALVKQKLSQHSNMLVGIRYDYGYLHTESYYDWFLSPVNNDNNLTLNYLQRVEEIIRNFSSFTWSAGYSYNIAHWSLKVNIGKSFRMPIAKELGANGVNYHNYSYEVGNTELSAEKSYQIDLNTEYKSKKFTLGVAPFVNFFPNYIYLNPSADYDRLYGNGNQIFRYTQSRVFRCGGELYAHCEPIRYLLLEMNAEYLYSLQLSGEKRGFGLPFSPPASALLSIKYSWDNIAFFEKIYVSANCRLTAKQTRIVPPEEITDGYQLFGLGAGCDIKIKRQKIILTFQIQNLFNKQYFNHTSFYRLINLPEAGRNFILNITFPFTGHFNQKNHQINNN